MEERLKYFIFNKVSDYRRGVLSNMEAEGNGIFVKAHSKEKGMFLSRILDSQKAEMNWHRLRIRGNEGKQAAFRLSVYSADQRNFIFQGKEMDLENFICKEDLELEEKLPYLSPWLQKQAAGQDEILLHEVRGRYLWFLIEMYWQPETAKLSDIQVYFPARSWIGYLPEIYRKEDKGAFLERYLGIFQTIYEDFNEEINRVLQNLDAESAQKKYLAWLAEWIGIKDCHIWSEKQLRRLLKKGVLLYRKRATRQGISDFVELYTEERPFIVENHQLLYFRKDRKRFDNLQRLYGSNSCSFTVLVREEVFDSARKPQMLLQLLGEIKPVQTECRLVLLKPYLFAGQHSYLGVNSVLGKYTATVLDGHSAVSFSVLQEKRS